ncbi:unnamed protein product [Calicophoron daubneyi]|uniref:NADH dehydrogenase [ubiquinone] 1 alpha subcomplex subunit 11 n=1 Tax=Calicophoron daubneyi TaxID=300641 RepID=A0AAV2TX18_CALDB
MLKHFYNYLSTPDYVDPLFRAKMAGFSGYFISFSGAAAYYSLAVFSGFKVRQAGLTCVRWMLAGATVGVTHAAGTYISAKACGDTNGWFNHMIGGATAGVVSAWGGPLSARIHRACGFAILSVLMKVYVQFIDEYPNFYVPRFGEHNPSHYLSLNHRWMNPEVKEQEKELFESL